MENMTDCIILTIAILGAINLAVLLVIDLRHWNIARLAQLNVAAWYCLSRGTGFYVTATDDAGAIRN